MTNDERLVFLKRLEDIQHTIDGLTASQRELLKEISNLDYKTKWILRHARVLIEREGAFLLKTVNEEELYMWAVMAATKEYDAIKHHR